MRAFVMATLLLAGLPAAPAWAASDSQSVQVVVIIPDRSALSRNAPAIPSNPPAAPGPGTVLATTSRNGETTILLYTYVDL